MVVPPPFVPQPPRTGSTTRNDTKLNNGTSGAVLPSMHNVRSSQAARHSGSDMTVAAAAFSSASGFRLPVVASPAAAESPPSAASTFSAPADDLTRAIPGWYYGVPRDGDSLRRRHERRAASVPFVNVKLMHSVAPRYLHHKIMSTIKTAAGTLQEEAPLYSSFSKDFAFRERDVAALV